MLDCTVSIPSSAFSFTTSLALSTIYVSLPAPPIITSAPVAPSMMLLLALPVMMLSSSLPVAEIAKFVIVRFSTLAPRV